jgi:hypothetical protein
LGDAEGTHLPVRRLARLCSRLGGHGQRATAPRRPRQMVGPAALRSTATQPGTARGGPSGARCVWLATDAACAWRLPRGLG